MTVTDPHTAAARPGRRPRSPSRPGGTAHVLANRRLDRDHHR